MEDWDRKEEKAFERMVVGGISSPNLTGLPKPLIVREFSHDKMSKCHIMEKYGHVDSDDLVSH